MNSRASARHDSWTVVAPVSRVELSSDVNYEFRIGSVTLIAREHLARRRRRFGFPEPLSALTTGKNGQFVKMMLEQSPTLAIVQVSGSKEKLQQELVRLLQDELAILSASQLGFCKRTNIAAPSIAYTRTFDRRLQLWIGKSGPALGAITAFGATGILQLTGNWAAFQKQLFFVPLLRILNNETPVASAWRSELRRAAILIGLSQSTTCLADAFLWNMIALELLLTGPNEKVKDALPSRAEALLGWSIDWKTDNFEANIRTAYRKRCEIVHQGRRDNISSQELYFTDDLLLNLLMNLVRQPKLFPSKAALIAFSKRVEAERLLGLQPSLKGLRMTTRQYNERDYNLRS